MGIPKFFRWLSRRYPLILQEIRTEEDCPPCDNLYLDMNAILHNCIHGNDPDQLERISAMSNYEEVWASIMVAIDEFVHSMKPEKLLMLAVDGVAPRAKMNQQRARRFRSAKEASEMKADLTKKGKPSDVFDTNQISPGTQFMFELSKQLHFFIKYKVSTDPLYQKLDKIVVSDVTVPGEGEHKIMDLIRHMRLSKDHDPNTRHCFYSPDADLIMLALLTHEPHFTIIKEKHDYRPKRSQLGTQRKEFLRPSGYNRSFQIIHISVLREYFLLEYKDLVPNMRMKFSLERIIDDFIFFNFFIGNDFLPTLFGLDIAVASLDRMIEFYKKCLPKMDDYITHNGTIYWDRAAPFLAKLASHEETKNQLTSDDKINYYKTKVKIDITTPQGRQDRKKMLYKYLEGSQWVLYYYYKGSQHWRWYYPYHYAPMISDLTNNICKDYIGGKNIISEFLTEEKLPLTPYTPFQQLFQIMPIKSMNLLPPPYAEAAKSQLSEYFPAEFKTDLNGKTLEWEAIILIPFCDERRIIAEETKILSELKLSLDEQQRNTTTMNFYVYKYASLGTGKVLKSTLAQFPDLKQDFSAVTMSSEYNQCGEFCYQSKLLPGVKGPNPSLPSLIHLNIFNLEKIVQNMFRVDFEIFLAKIPQVKAERNPGELQKFVDQLVTKNSRTVYVDFPYQIEARIVMIEDKKTVYQFYEQRGKLKVEQRRQTRGQDELFGTLKRHTAFAKQKGLFIPENEIHVLVSVNRVTGMEYDHQTGKNVKVFGNENEYHPLSTVMLKRHHKNYKNVNNRVREAVVKPKQQVVCIREDLFGIQGELVLVTQQKKLKVKFDIKTEESKIHDPFIGKRYFKKQKKPESKKPYFTSDQIEVLIGAPTGSVHQITGTFMIQFNDPVRKNWKKNINIGLNLKNWSKKKFVQDYVRFRSEGNDTRGIWEYSTECVDIISLYYSRYPEAWKALEKAKKIQGMYNPITELYPREDGQQDLQKIDFFKTILEWITTLPSSKLPWVQIGFQKVEAQTINGLQASMSNSSTSILKKDTEVLEPYEVVFENYPYWCSPFMQSQLTDFKMGDRVINLNSTKRSYIPFGLRGTVIGRTQTQIMVAYDNPFLSGSSLNGSCPEYKGALMQCEDLMNITEKFREHKVQDKNNKESWVNQFLKQKQNTNKKQKVEHDYSPEDEISLTNSSDQDVDLPKKRKIKIDRSSGIELNKDAQVFVPNADAPVFIPQQYSRPQDPVEAVRLPPVLNTKGRNNKRGRGQRGRGRQLVRGQARTGRGSRRKQKFTKEDRLEEEQRFQKMLETRQMFWQSQSLFDLRVQLSTPKFRGVYQGKTYHKNDKEVVIKRAKAYGVKGILLNCNANIQEIIDTLEFCKKNEGCYVAVGFVPWKARILWDQLPQNGREDDKIEIIDDFMQKLDELIQEDQANESRKILCIGMCGFQLDRLNLCSKKIQLYALNKHIDLAEKFNLPLQLTVRFTEMNIYENEFYRLLGESRHRFPSGVIIEFGGNHFNLKALIELDLYVGVSAFNLRTYHSTKIVKQIPLDRIVLASNSPFSDHNNNPGSIQHIRTQFKVHKKTTYDPESENVDKMVVAERNEPCKITQSAEIIAATNVIPLEELTQKTYQNTLALLGLKERHPDDLKRVAEGYKEIQVPTEKISQAQPTQEIEKKLSQLPTYPEEFTDEHYFCAGKSEEFKLDVDNMDQIYKDLESQRLIVFGEYSNLKQIIQLECDIITKLAQTRTVHLLIQLFSFEMQYMLDDFCEGKITFHELLEEYEQVDTERLDLLSYKPIFDLTQENKGKIVLHAGTLPRPYALQYGRSLMRSGEQALILQQAKKRSYISEQETLPFVKQHYHMYETVLSGKSLNRYRVSQRYRRQFKVQLLQDASMAYQVNKIQQTTGKNDVILCICKLESMLAGFGVAERIWNLSNNDQDLIKETGLLHIQEKKNDELTLIVEKTTEQSILKDEESQKEEDESIHIENYSTAQNITLLAQMYDIPLNQSESDYPAMGNVETCQSIIDPAIKPQVSDEDDPLDEPESWKEEPTKPEPSVLEKTAPKYIDPDLTFLLEIAMIDLACCEEIKQSLLAEDLCIQCTVLEEQESSEKLEGKEKYTRVMVVRVSEEQLPYVTEWLDEFDEGELIQKREEVMSKKAQERKIIDQKLQEKQRKKREDQKVVMPDILAGDEFLNENIVQGNEYNTIGQKYTQLSGKQLPEVNEDQIEFNIGQELEEDIFSDSESQTFTKPLFEEKGSFN